MRFNAVYTGIEDKIGFKTGEQYALQLLKKGEIISIVYCEPPAKGIYWQGKQVGQCPYSNWKTFWQNWKLAV